ncbi:MAG TPA: cysteine synthase B, partial [Tenacibaculum sp.]|nr:cysteine synthase B [Tenacibaculum sp.]
GGALKIALEISNQIDKGIIVAIVCDRGDRYLSSGLYDYGM